MGANCHEKVSLSFVILGPIEIHANNRLLNVPAGRQQAVLSRLLLEANQVVSIDSLIQTIWDSAPPVTARTQVLICISKLRQSFARAGAECPIVTRSPGYLIKLANDQCDYQLFEDMFARATQLAHDGRLADAAGLLDEALALWRGPALADGEFSPVLRAKATRLDERRLTAVETRVDLKLRLGQHHEIIDELASLVDQQPLRERLRGQLMIALYRSGRQADALDVYRRGRDLLVTDLGLDPSDELRTLEQAILVKDKALQLDNGTSSAVVQQGIPMQLPPALPDFVGRTELLDQILDFFTTGTTHAGAVRVGVISGMPGVGKSTLATLAAHRLAERFPDAQLYYDMRGVSVDPQTPLRRFLRALGVAEEDIPAGLDQRIDMYRSVVGGRRVLIVLENIASEQDLLPLLPSSANSAVIVTSRTRLVGSYVSHVFDLDTLRPDDAVDMLRAIIGSGRVGAEPGAARQLVDTVGRLPLAIRIAGARLVARQHLSLEAMVARLPDHPLDELTHGVMSVRGSLRSAYEALAERPRRLLRLIGLLGVRDVAGWVPGALLAGGPVAATETAVDMLVDCRLLDVAGPDHLGGPHYRMHELVRTFACERAMNEEPQHARTAAIARVVSGWLTLAVEANRALSGTRVPVTGDAVTWSAPEQVLAGVRARPADWLAAEGGAIAAAIRLAAVAGLHQLSCDLALASGPLFGSHGFLDRWRDTHAVALAAARRSGNRGRVTALQTSLAAFRREQRNQLSDHSGSRPSKQARMRH